MNKEQKVKFAIFGHARSGSNLLISMLDLSDEIISHGEVFNPYETIYSKKNKEELSLDIKLRDKDTIRFLNSVYESGFKDYRAVGIKHFLVYDHLISNYLASSSNIKKIILTRKNFLRAYVSLQIAFHTKVWACGETKYSDYQQMDKKIKVNLADFFDNHSYLTKRLNEIEEIMNRDNQKVFRITYEELASSSMKKRVREVFNFISTEIVIPELKTSLKKQNPKELKDYITNYDEVSSALRGTQYEWMLTEP